MKKVLIATLLACSAFAQQVPWMHLDAGVQLAQKHNAPMVVFVYSDTCGFCHEAFMDFNENTRLNGAARGFVPVAINVLEVNADQKYAKYETQSVPALYFTDSKGNPLAPASIGGFDPDNMAVYMEKFKKWFKENR